MANSFGLNDRQDKFARYFVQTGNKSEAMRKAGYKEKYAATNSDKLLRNTKVQEAIDFYRSKLNIPDIADMQEVNRFWSKVMRDDEEATANRLKASELRAKTQGAFMDKVQLSGGMKVDANNPFADLTTAELKKLANKK